MAAGGPSHNILCFVQYTKPIWPYVAKMQDTEQAHACIVHTDLRIYDTCI